ncbi:MAG: phosphotransferase, partial [Chloroflexota bacterium]
MNNPVTLQVRSSLISPESMAQFVRHAYFPDDQVDCALMSFGDNDTYVISVNGTQYALRVYRYNKYWLQNESDYLFELDWLAYLHQKGLSVSYPIQRKDGGFLGNVEAPEGIRYCALFSWAEGAVTGYDAMTETRCFRLGEAVANIHIESDAFQTKHARLKIDLEFLLDKPLERIKHFLKDHRMKDVAQIAQHADRLKSKITDLNLDDSWGIIGGDFHGWNLHFTDNDDLTLFDFDLCGYGWRAFDLAVYRWEQGKKEGKWIPFLNGYQSLRTLSQAELDAIPLFVDIRQIWMMGSHTTYPFATRWSL